MQSVLSTGLNLASNGSTTSFAHVVIGLIGLLLIILGVVTFFKKRT